MRSADIPRALGTVPAMALVIANMIGTGIFVTSGFLARDLGSAWLVLATWLAGGVLALCGATVYAELGAMFPCAGGEYVYLSRIFHPALGFLSGWVSIVVGFAAPIAASAMSFASYAHAVFPSVPVRGAALSLIVVLSALHMAHVAIGAHVQTAFTALKVLLLVGFAAGGLVFGRGELVHLAQHSGAPRLGDVAVGLVLVGFAYSGWNAAAYVAGELREPSKTLPRALIFGTSFVVVLYLALNVAFFYAAPPGVLGAQPEIVADVAARALFGPALGDLLSALVALALVSSVSAMIMAGPRVPMAMAEDGLFFAVFARRSRGGAPFVSIGVQALVAIALAVTATFEDLLTYIGFVLSLFSALTVLGAVVLRIREPDRPRPYRAFAWPWTPVLFVLSACGMVALAVHARPLAALYGLLTLGLGGLGFWLWTRSRSPR